MMGPLDHGARHDDISMVVVYLVIVVLIAAAVIGHWLWRRRQDESQ